MDIEIAPVTDSAKTHALAALAKEIWNQHFPAIIGQQQVDYMLEKFQSPESIRSQIDSGYEYYLALLDNKPAGYIAVIPDSPPGKMMLSKIYVKDTFRGAGLGARLLDFVENRAMASNARTLWLTVNKDNTRVIDWYTRRGFSITDEVKKDIGSGFYMDDYIMEYDLG